MKNHNILLFVLCLVGKEALSQAPRSDTVRKTPKSFSNGIAAGLSFPMGTYGRTHTAGITLDYTHGSHRYGNDAMADRLFGFAFNAGLSYNGGESAPTAGYEFNYGGNFIVHAAAGVDYNPAMALNVALLAGPVVNFYEGNVDAGVGITLFWNYFISKNISLGPGLNYRTQSKTDALWSGVFRALYAF